MRLKTLKIELNWIVKHSIIKLQLIELINLLYFNEQESRERSSVE